MTNVIVGNETSSSGKAIQVKQCTNGKIIKTFFPSGNRFNERICPGCGKPVEQGQKRHRTAGHRIYHIKCFMRKQI